MIPELLPKLSEKTDMLTYLRTVAEKMSSDPDALPANLHQEIYRKIVAFLMTLSSRERDIFLLTCAGKNPKETAKQLFITRNTVKRHRANICQKLGIEGNNCLTLYAQEFQYLSRLLIGVQCF